MDLGFWLTASGPGESMVFRREERKWKYEKALYLYGGPFDTNDR
jgi:hypothetical protein